MKKGSEQRDLQSNEQANVDTTPPPVNGKATDGVKKMHVHSIRSVPSRMPDLSDSDIYTEFSETDSDYSDSDDSSAYEYVEVSEYELTDSEPADKQTVTAIGDVKQEKMRKQLSEVVEDNETVEGNKTIIFF